MFCFLPFCLENRGHEHECAIELQESVVGTFRITQPGSSVATSLTQGEAALKQVGILDIKGTRFRMRPIPLTQVRTFVMGDVSLAAQKTLDPDDPKVDIRVAEVLENKVRVLLHDAKTQREDRIQQAWRKGNVLADPVYRDNPDQFPLQEKLLQPKELLVRIRVEHLGFQALNNQRFGAKFVGQVANPVSESCCFKMQPRCHHGNGSFRSGAICSSSNLLCSCMYNILIL